MIEDLMMRQAGLEEDLIDRLAREAGLEDWLFPQYQHFASLVAARVVGVRVRALAASILQALLKFWPKVNSPKEVRAIS